MSIYTYRPRAKPDPRALQWLGNYNELVSFLRYRPFKIDGATNTILFDTPLNPNNAKSDTVHWGAWIIETEHGFDVLSDDTFLRDYDAEEVK